MNNVLLFFCFVLMSCASTKTYTHKNIKFGNDLMIKTENFLNIFPNNSKISQLVSYTENKSNKKVQVVFAKHKDLKITVLSPMGIELLSLSVTDKKIERIGGIGQFKMDIFYKVMADMLAVYSSKQLLYNDIIGDVEIQDSDSQRVIKSNSQKIMTINFDQANLWKSDISIDHHQFKYNLLIKTLVIKYENIHK